MGPQNVLENIPAEMRRAGQWIVWKLEGKTDIFKGTKVPRQVKNPFQKASTTDPGTWGSFGEAVAMAALENLSGVGYVFQEGDGIVAIDLDNCIGDDGQPDERTREILNIFKDKTYIELSYSRKGYHILCRGTIPEGRLRGVEIYNSGRYFAMTGEVVNGCTSLGECQAEIDLLFQKYGERTQAPTTQIPGGIVRHYGSISDNYGLRVEDIGMPVNAQDRGGGKLQGGHPFHGSTTGHNFTIDTRSNVWYCFRDGHRTGGDALVLFAVREGIVRCEDVRKGCLDGKWPEVFAALERAGYRNRNEKKPAPGEGGEDPGADLAKIHKAADTQERGEYLKRIADGVITWNERVIHPDDPKKRRVEREEVIDYPLFAERISQALGTISFAGEIWINHGGIYTRDYGAVKALITDVINASGITHQIHTVVAEVKDRVVNRNPFREYPFNEERDLIPVANGVVHINPDGKIDILPHDVKYRFNYRLPVSYDPEAPIEPVMAVLRSWVDEEDVPSLIQLPAQALLQAQERVVYKRAYLFEGERDTGKSTYWLLIHSLIGDEQMGDAELGAIGINRFALASLEGTLINFYDDLGAFPLAYLGPFKRVTGSVWHQIERKGKDSYNGLVTAVHAFTCNAPPRLMDLFDDAFFSRWNYLVFPNTFAPDPQWAARTYVPVFLSGFLNLVLQALVQIKKSGHLTHTMEGIDVQERWIYATEPVQRFVNEELDIVAGEWEATEKVWDRWIGWARENGVAPRTKASLTRRLSPLGIPARLKERGKTRAYEGVRLKDGSSDVGKKPKDAHPDWKWRDEMPDDAPNYGLGG